MSTMKHLFGTLLLFSALSLVASQTYQLVWSDEFNGNSLDTTKWNYEVNCDGGGNNELQCYTSSPDNVQVSGGYLSITAKPQNYNGKQYTSGRINTNGHAAWKFGKFEVRAKMPRGDYLWPALWMMPRDSVYGSWAASGEIDIFEGMGQSPNLYQSTLHYGGGWPNNVYQGSNARYASVDLTADFHVYTCEWTADAISFALDGNVYYTRNLDVSFWSGRGNNPYSTIRQPFDQPFYFIMNLAVDGNFFGAQSNSLNLATAYAWQSPSMVVDYVRAYQIVSGGNSPVPVPVPVPTTAAPATTTVAPSTPAPQNNNACPNGCGYGSCCNDARIGGVCYSPSTYHCVADSSSAFHLCALGNAWCGNGCYQQSIYQCVNNQLWLL